MQSEVCLYDIQYHSSYVGNCQESKDSLKFTLKCDPALKYFHFKRSKVKQRNWVQCQKQFCHKSRLENVRRNTRIDSKTRNHYNSHAILATKILSSNKNLNVTSNNDIKIKNVKNHCPKRQNSVLAVVLSGQSFSLSTVGCRFNPRLQLGYMHEVTNQCNTSQFLSHSPLIFHSL